MTERMLNLKVDGILTTPIKPKKMVFHSKHMQRFACAMVSFCRPRSRVLSHKEVVDLYRGSKFRVYTKAYNDYLHDGCHEHHSRLAMFIKFEKTNIDKAPRIINPRTPVYNLCLARYLKKLEKIAYAGVNHLFGGATDHTVIKGLDVYASARVIKAKWDLFVDPVAIGGDITKLDMHIRSDALRYEHSIYNRIFQSKTLKKLLKMQLRNRGSAWFPDGSINFDLPGTRCSGDINTSLGNVLIVCSVLYAFKNHHKVDFELINNGDDFVVVCERSLAHTINSQLPSWFTKFGFVLQMEETVDQLEQLEFCQTRPVFDGVEWRMCRIPHTIFRKDTICTIPLQNERVYRQWLDAVGKCGQAITANLPVLYSFYSAYVRAGKPCKEGLRNFIFKNTSIIEKMGKLKVPHVGITDDARVSFYQAFGIMPDVQKDLERYFDSLVIGYDLEEMVGLIRDNNLLATPINL